MAALPYIQFYVADYLADTMHLSTEEHGAYLLLIFNYWQTGKPIPKNRLSKIARLSNDRWSSVEDSLNEFFIDNGTEWVHKRIESDLAIVQESQAQRSAAGKASAEARKRQKSTKNKREINDRSTTVKSPLNENPTNKEQIRTDTDTDTDNNIYTPPPDPIETEFAEIKAAYPKRSGSNPWTGKQGAIRNYRARRKEGHTFDDMLAGTKRYAAYCAANGSIGTEFVMQATRFLGTGLEFSNEWSYSPQRSPPNHSHRDDGKTQEQRDAEMQAWLNGDLRPFGGNKNIIEGEYERDN